MRGRLDTRPKVVAVQESFFFFRTKAAAVWHIIRDRSSFDRGVHCGAMKTSTESTAEVTGCRVESPRNLRASVRARFYTPRRGRRARGVFSFCLNTDLAAAPCVLRGRLGLDGKILFAQTFNDLYTKHLGAKKLSGERL